MHLGTLKKNVPAHEHQHLARNLSQERSIEIGNQRSYCGCTVQIREIFTEIKSFFLIELFR